MRNKDTFTPKTPLVLSQHMHELLVGTLLGDGSMQSLPAGRTWSYPAVQGAAQKEYLFHKYEILKDFCSTPPTEQEIQNAVGKKRTRWYFNTRRMGIFDYYGRLFYVPVETPTPTRAWVKCVPATIEDLLTPKVLAYWYMDDGDQKWRGRSRAFRISVNSFT